MHFNIKAEHREADDLKVKGGAEWADATWILTSGQSGKSTTFGIDVTDVNGNTGSQTFVIIVTAPGGGGSGGSTGSAFVFLA